jgi:serine/threonine-protein kinase HipA
MDIFVYADWQGLKEPRKMGTLSVVHTKGREVFTFSYHKSWLDGGLAQNIDPDLQFFSGPQYLSVGKQNFGIFLDSSPDRWGRVLMDRREAILARSESRKPKTLFEEDYLLGVFDTHRMGALRFKLIEDGNFLSENSLFATPPWTSLRALEQASLQLEKDDLKDEEAIKWINMLIAPGSSLGGARPKASVTDTHGHLWIAKFPSVRDRTDVGGWEMVANKLSEQSGIVTAPGIVRKFHSKQHTFLTKRFDRTVDKARLHFASAMTLLGKVDGAEGASYLDIAEFIMQNGERVKEDLAQLWRRIVFNIAIKNTDDHLRNHGFILSQQGWILSPAFDVNPVYHGKGLTLNISETDNSLDLELARSVAENFRVDNTQAVKIIQEVQQAVKGWRKIAAKYRISKQEQDMMASAFEG